MGEFRFIVYADLVYFTNAQVMSVKYDNKRCREFVLRKTFIFCLHISKQYLSETHTMLMQENNSCDSIQRKGQLYTLTTCQGNFHHKKDQ